MAMRETENSLRAYFLIAGAIAVMLAFRDIHDVSKLDGLAIPMSWKLALWFPLLARLGIGVGFVIAGVRLRAALPLGAVWIKRLLLASVGALVVAAMLIGWVFGADVGQSGLGAAVIGLAITAYLYASVKRLAAEAMARTVPPAIVV